MNMGGSRDGLKGRVQDTAAGDPGNDSDHDELFEDAVDTNSSCDIEAMYRQLTAEARDWSLDSELGRSSEITTAHVKGLRSWCQDSGVLPDIPDWLLVAFLHCCRSDLDLAKSVMRVYESVRTKTPEVFADRPFNSEEVQRAKTIGYVIALPRTTPEGHRIIVQALRNPDPSVFVYSSSSKVQFLTMDALVRAQPTAEGYVCIFDMQGVQMSHMWAWGFRLPRKIFKYLQEGLPLRMQRIHFVNATPLMDRVMRMLRPFINKELLSVFNFHSADDMSKLHDFIPRECLPQNYGGTLPPLEKLQDFTDLFLAEVDTLLT